MKEPDLDDTINEEYARGYDAGFADGKGSCRVEIGHLAEVINELQQALDHLRRSIDGYDVAFEVASEIAGDAWSQDDEEGGEL